MSKAEKPERVRNCPKRTREKVQENWDGILNGLIERAKNGEYSQAKLLLEFSGLAEEAESKKPKAKAKDPLRELAMDLKRQMAKRDEQRRAAELEAKELGAGEAAGRGTGRQQ